MKIIVELDPRQRRLIINALASKIENLLQHMPATLLEEDLDDWMALVKIFASATPDACPYAPQCPHVRRARRTSADDTAKKPQGDRPA